MRQQPSRREVPPSLRGFLSSQHSVQLQSTHPAGGVLRWCLASLQTPAPAPQRCQTSFGACQKPSMQPCMWSLRQAHSVMQACLVVQLQRRLRKAEHALLLGHLHMTTRQMHEVEGHHGAVTTACVCVIGHGPHAKSALARRRADLGRVCDECLVLLHSRRRGLAGPHSRQLVQQQPVGRETGFPLMPGLCVGSTLWGATAWLPALPLQLQRQCWTPSSARSRQSVHRLSLSLRGGAHLQPRSNRSPSSCGAWTSGSMATRSTASTGPASIARTVNATLTPVSESPACTSVINDQPDIVGCCASGMFADHCMLGRTAMTHALPPTAVV